MIHVQKCSKITFIELIYNKVNKCLWFENAILRVSKISQGHTFVPNRHRHQTNGK